MKGDTMQVIGTVHASIAYGLERRERGGEQPDITPTQRDLLSFPKYA
jgi:hypothetical protein